ncbi:MAG: hypothetical protein RR623_09970 [Bacilli bacterium]
MPLAVECGLTIEQFLYMTEDEFQIYQVANVNKMNKMAWLTGYYVQQAICSVLPTPKNSKPFEYPSKPISQNKESAKVEMNDLEKEEELRMRMCECY